MRHIKLFEEYTSPKKTIIILGLPGSGKSHLAKKIQEENPDMDYKIYDDFQFMKASENFGKENQIISDGMLMVLGLSDSTKKDIKDSGSGLEIIYFENDPEKALSNIERRNNFSDVLSHQKNISRGELNMMSGRYGSIIPPDAKVLPIWKAD
jgi:hypothetical protein